MNPPTVLSASSRENASWRRILIMRGTVKFGSNGFDLSSSTNQSVGISPRCQPAKRNATLKETPVASLAFGSACISWRRTTTHVPISRSSGGRATSSRGIDIANSNSVRLSTGPKGNRVCARAARSTMSITFSTESRRARSISFACCRARRSTSSARCRRFSSTKMMMLTIRAPPVMITPIAVQSMSESYPAPLTLMSFGRLEIDGTSQ